MKGECDAPKPIYEPSNEINLYSYVHQAILMPEDGKSFTIKYLFFTYVLIILYFVDFMFDKDDNIEISSTKSHNNSSRPESRNLEDRYVNMLFTFHYNKLYNNIINSICLIQINYYLKV